MARESSPRHAASLAASHDTALCLLPPKHLWPPLERLRSLHDKAYGRWPPHLNLIYPFVDPRDLLEAVGHLSQLGLGFVPDDGLDIRLGGADVFVHKRHNSIILKPSEAPNQDPIARLVEALNRALGRSQSTASQPHLTIAQTHDISSDSHKFLVAKAELLTPLHWKSCELAILERVPAACGDAGASERQMNLWGTMDLRSCHMKRFPVPEDFYLDQDSVKAISTTKASFEPSFQYQSPSNRWLPLDENSVSVSDANYAKGLPERLVVASYNVLAEFEWPPNSERFPQLLTNILSTRALADIIVLQEVTDLFLSTILRDERIQVRYPFSSHGPPDDSNVGPLPNLLNIVVLSAHPINWQYLPFQRKHKGAVVVKFPTLTVQDDNSLSARPLILAAVHLTQGLVDGAIVAKKNELQRLFQHLSTYYAQHPWIVAGDFNLATSAYTIDMARTKQDITNQGYQYLKDIVGMFAQNSLRDAWLAARVALGESSSIADGTVTMSRLYEGEQGATFDPLSNGLARSLVGSGLNHRPQRYDRILVDDRLTLRPLAFNMFGQTATASAEPHDKSFASDHWGIRCLLTKPSKTTRQHSDGHDHLAIDQYEASPPLESIDDLRAALSAHHTFPSEDDDTARAAAVELLRRILNDAGKAALGDNQRSQPEFLLVPVGSTGLGVWTTSSDVDCLCIGSVSSRTFFILALQRMRRAVKDGIALIRRVKANSGTMLEVAIRGLKFNLQYCAATSIADKWPEVMRYPSDDPVFSLPIQALAKLKPLRDLFYLKKSIPDIAQYRLAHLLIKAWAKSRGLYAAKFGLLGGIHISILLVPVYKVLVSRHGSLSTADLIVSFFHHYAHFDWKTQHVYDPFFHKNLRYHRTFREPLCLLGWHPPALNTAMSASASTVKTLAAELSRASKMLLTDNVTWASFLGNNATAVSGTNESSASEFLTQFDTYIRIDAHYWGPSVTRRAQFLGWIESRCVSLLVDLDRRVPSVIHRIWPVRFEEQTGDVAEHLSLESHGCHLIGLELDSDRLINEPRGDPDVLEGAIYSLLRDFETRMRAEERYHDAKVSWMDASLVQGKDVQALRPDPMQWVSATAMDAGLGTDDDSDLEEDVDEGVDDEAIGQSFATDASKHRAPQSRHSTPLSRDEFPGLGKFRTATDVMNRLRWDDKFDTSDYVVGYEDRFLGAQEREIEQWKTEQTDEEFIPQHRVLYFKRKSDGELFWERRTRIDKIFGSGI